MVVLVYDFVVSSSGAHYLSQFIPSSCLWFDFLKNVSCEDQFTGNLTQNLALIMLFMIGWYILFCCGLTNHRNGTCKQEVLFFETMSTVTKLPNKLEVEIGCRYWLVRSRNPLDVILVSLIRDRKPCILCCYIGTWL